MTTEIECIRVLILSYGILSSALEDEFTMEKSDLQKLKREVLDHGAEAALPSRLSDIWLSLLARDLDMLLQEHQEDHHYLSAPLAIIIHILYGKHGNKGKEVSFSEDDLFRYLHYLRIEIALEMIRRTTDVITEPATLDSIFSNRDVHIVKQT